MKTQKYLCFIVVVLIVIGFISLVEAEQAKENLALINGYPTILLDPALAADWYDTQVAYNIYSPLVYPTPDGTIRPHLAEKWEPVDGKLDHWRFTLKQGVKFHDGSEITSEDVSFSMDRFISMGKGYSSVLGKVIATPVDKYTVDFTLENPSVLFPETLTLFYPVNKDLVLEHIESGKYGEFGDYGENWLATNDAGSGPYMVTNHTPGERMEAERFEDYFLGWEDWGPNEEPIEKLLFIMETETSTLMLLLKSGQLQLEANGGFSRKLFREIINTESLNLHSVWPQVWTVWMNTRVAPTDDLHFRRAIQYAYDYEALLNEYADFGTKEAGIYPSMIPGYMKIPPQPRRQNLEKAKEELALSKYDPEDVKVVFHYSGGLEAQEEIALQLQADMAKLGVKVEVAGPARTQFVDECSSPETTPNLSIQIFPLNYPTPDAFLYYMYHPDLVGGIYASHWYADEEIGRIIDQSRQTLDFEERTEMYRQLQEKISSLALALYPYEAYSLFTSQDYLIGPKEKFPVVGPTVNMHNWRINLEMKQK